MRIFHWHYLKELLANFFLTFGVLYFVALMVAVSRLTYHSAGLDPWLVLKTMLLWSVDPLPHLIPVAIMIGVVLTYGRASADNEILAVRMGGVHLYQVILPAVLVGVLLSCVNAWLLSDVIPAVYFTKYRSYADVASQFFSKTNPVNNLINFSNFRMRWEHKKDGRFQKVWIDYKEKGVCGFAEEVWIDPPQDQRIQIGLRKFRGFRAEGIEDGQREGQTFMAASTHIAVDVEELLSGRQRRLRYKDMTSTQLFVELKSKRIWESELAMHQLCSRMSHSIVALLFALIGAPIGIMFRRGGRMAAFGLSFFPILIYYGFVFMGKALVVSQGSPILVGWSPAAALLCLGVFLNWKVSRI